MSKSKKRLDNPIPIRMKELKPIYQQEASRQERSMHWLILSVLKKAPFVITSLEESQNKKQ